MNKLTQQMLDDYKLCIKQDHWDDFRRARLEEINELGFGDITSIQDVYYPDSNRLKKRLYKYANGYTFVLDLFRAGLEALPPV